MPGNLQNAVHMLASVRGDGCSSFAGRVSTAAATAATDVFIIRTQLEPKGWGGMSNYL